MRLITNEELVFVGGADSGWLEVGAKMLVATALGSAGGASMAVSSSVATTTTAEILGVATLGGVVAAGLTGSLIVGTFIGEALNEHTPIQGWIADVLDFSLGGEKNDASYFQNVSAL